MDTDNSFESVLATQPPDGSTCRWLNLLALPAAGDPRPKTRLERLMEQTSDLEPSTVADPRQRPAGPSGLRTTAQLVRINP
jgi:hypothetical protein